MREHLNPQWLHRFPAGERRFAKSLVAPKVDDCLILAVILLLIRVLPITIVVVLP